MKKICSIDGVPQAMSRGKRFRFISTVSLISPLQPDTDSVGLAVVASKKAVHKKAVHRNRAKRRVRAAVHTLVRTHFHELSPSINWVIICQKSILTVSWQNLLNELQTALERWGHGNVQNSSR